jgi:hypothetical protein
VPKTRFWAPHPVRRASLTEFVGARASLAATAGERALSSSSPSPRTCGRIIATILSGRGSPLPVACATRSRSCEPMGGAASSASELRSTPPTRHCRPPVRAHGWMLLSVATLAKNERRAVVVERAEVMKHKRNAAATTPLAMPARGADPRPVGPGAHPGASGSAHGVSRSSNATRPGLVLPSQIHDLGGPSTIRVRRLVVPSLRDHVHERHVGLSPTSAPARQRRVRSRPSEPNDGAAGRIRSWMCRNGRDATRVSADGFTAAFKGDEQRSVGGEVSSVEGGGLADLQPKRPGK